VFKYVLIPTTGQESDELVFNTALAVGRMFAAHLAFLHVSIDVEQVALAMLSGAFAGRADISAAIESLQERGTPTGQGRVGRPRLLSQKPAAASHPARWRNSVGGVPQ